MKRLVLLAIVMLPLLPGPASVAEALSDGTAGGRATATLETPSPAGDGACFPSAGDGSMLANAMGPETIAYVALALAGLAIYLVRLWRVHHSER